MVTTLAEATAVEPGARSADAIGAYFDSLGRAVERAWAGYHNNEALFPELATRVLAETPILPMRTPLVCSSTSPLAIGSFPRGVRLREPPVTLPSP